MKNKNKIKIVSESYWQKLQSNALILFKQNIESFRTNNKKISQMVECISTHIVFSVH